MNKLDLQLKMINMKSERHFEENTYLTDGESVIKIGDVLKPDWTPINNYGRKDYDYWFCSTYPDNLEVDGTRVIFEEYCKTIPGCWFQKGYHLRSFKPISKTLLHPKIIKHLNHETETI